MRTGLCVKFPDHQGRYREFSRFCPSWSPPAPEKALSSLGFLSKFPTQRNREFFLANRELNLPIREFPGRSRETRFVGSTPSNRSAYDGNQFLGGTLPVALARPSELSSGRPALCINGQAADCWSRNSGGRQGRHVASRSRTTMRVSSRAKYFCGLQPLAMTRSRRKPAFSSRVRYSASVLSAPPV
jgi:hypothetical protein